MTTSTWLSAGRRSRDLDALGDRREIDVLVIGGGVTGCGVALDAATRGLSVVLVERADLASGTSRWSSKLVHGGLRYLAQGDLALARESAVERNILMGRTAPHLTRALPMAVPVVAGTGRVDAIKVELAHRLAHALGAGGTARRAGLPAPRRLGRLETLAVLPALAPAGLRGALINYDGQLEDDARLVIALARTAAGAGATILTRVRADAVDGRGAALTDVCTGASLRLAARSVISAAGVWAGSVDPSVSLRPSKGSHLVLAAERLGHPRASMTVAVLGERNRYVFALPQPDGLVYVGLTDDPLDGQPPDEPTVTDTETDFLLDTISRVLAVPLTRDDVLGSYAGLRPLLAGTEGRTADLSRRHAVTRGRSGAWSMVGGKLTTYRRMAQDAVDAVLPQLGRPVGRCRTADLPLVGATRAAPTSRLERRYGTEAAEVAACGPVAPVAAGVPVALAELIFGVVAEGALTVDDLLARRTRLSLVPAWAELAGPAAHEALAAVPSSKPAAADQRRPAATSQQG